MTIREASGIFARRELRFGDDRSIEAARIMEQIGECRDALWSCEHDGAVETAVECHYCDAGSVEASDDDGTTYLMECLDCDGTGQVLKLCPCIAHFHRDIIFECIKKIDRDTARRVRAAIPPVEVPA